MILRCTSCGKSLQVEDRFVGKKVKCPCNAVLQVPNTVPTPALTPQKTAPLRSAATVGSQTRSAPPGPVRTSAGLGSNYGEMSSLFDELTSNDMVTKKRAEEGHGKKKVDPLAAYTGTAKAPSRPANQPAASKLTSGSTVTGILMMIGAVVWFFGGLAAGVIFFYPPVMFVLGLIALVKGLTSRDG